MEPASLPAPPRRWPLTLLVISLHAVLLAGLQWGLSKRRAEPAPEARRVTVMLLPDRRVRAVTPPLPARPVTERRASDRPPAPDAPPRAAPTPLPTEAPPPPATTAEVPASLALPPTAAASGPHDRLIDSAATRAALRQSARDPLSGERHLEAQGQEVGVSASEKLGRKIQQAGYGDCGKGQYAGGGMGLLSAPFYLLAEASGKCAKGNPPPAAPPPPEPSGRKGAHASMRDR
ncbi:hypothetical protein QRD43_14145 [Pelomonas sp. APW6]|uniref:Uncharacterized protein n=1 Tax=Roseateles subflavus TaxID=3053353 RepID=A0ABT7LJK7_9BURK|nr:hypothetical protein [Pelomonas sp. APW6]MDL5033051.1 hypothetical protein [Pelomonas sp. APW6]